MVIPTQPNELKDIDPSGPFFTLPSGENMTKIDVYIRDDPKRRVLGFTSDKLIEAGTRMSKNGVMDATFKVGRLWSYVN